MPRPQIQKRILQQLAHATLLGLIIGASIHGQPLVRTHLKKILVLDKNQTQSHIESRRDLNAALKELSEAQGFTVTTIGQNDPASKISTEFSRENLPTYQVVIFSNNDGVDKQLDATSKANLEEYVKNGGGLIPIHAASAFITSWPFLTSSLVQSFYGPHGSNQPTANLAHDPEGLMDGTEAKGIFKGLTAPLAFLDEFYSFNSSPRGIAGVTILLTVDESSYSKTVNGPMGKDHPVVWSKLVGKGKVVHMSLGHSWSTNNVYTAKNAYLKNFLYGALRFVAGDFLGCTDRTNRNYNPDATQSDPTKCWVTEKSISQKKRRLPDSFVISKQGNTIEVIIRSKGLHRVTLLDASGQQVESRRGASPTQYSLQVPAQPGFYWVRILEGTKTHIHRFTSF